MPAQKAKSSLVAKLGDKGRQAHEAHKADETKLSSGGDIPAGIENGIAQVVDVKFGVYETGDFVGEFFFRAAAIIKAPVEITLADGSVIPIEGLRTQIGPEPLCETPTRSRKSLEDHIAWVYNELRKMGVPTSELQFEDLESVALALEETKPHIRFRTWAGSKQDLKKDGSGWILVDGKGKKLKGPYATEEVAKAANPYAGQEPRTQHDWRGPVNYEGDSTVSVEDNTGEAPWDKDAAGEKPAETPKAETKKEEKKPATATPKAKEDKKPATKAVESADYDALAAIADGADGEEARDAQRVIAGQCKLFNVNSEESASWTDAVTELQVAMAAQGGGGTTPPKETAEGSEEFVPAETEIYYYTPSGGKKTECEVKKVFASSKKVNLLNMDDGKTQYKGVAWGALDQG